MSPLDDDVDNVPWSLQVRLRPTACESARWRHRVSLSVCCCVSRACSVLQLQGALSMPPSTRRPPPASWTPCVGVALTGVVCARVNCFPELIVVVLYLCSSCPLVFVPAMPPSCMKVHAHALSVGKLMCGSNKQRRLRLHGRGRGAPLSLDECPVNGRDFAHKLGGLEDLEREKQSHRAVPTQSPSVG